MNRPTLWNIIESRLDSSLPRWQRRIEGFGQLAAVEARSAGQSWSDDKVFKALLMAVLSANTEWSKIESVQAKLADLFCGYSLDWYAERSDTEVGDRFVPWFKDRKAGSPNLKRNLAYLIRTARKLLQYSKTHGTADGYFTSLLDRCGGDPKLTAMRLGCSGVDKLPAFGVPVAAEALKNLGFDVAKPDRHVMRAIGSFELVRFDRWRDARDSGNGRQPPNPTPTDQLAAMTAVQELAEAVGKRVIFVDNAIFLLCAKSGLYLANRELAAIGRKSDLPEDQGGRTSQERAERLGAMIQSWTREDDAGEQQETLEHLVRALDEDRSSSRKLFPQQLKGKSW